MCLYLLHRFKPKLPQVYLWLCLWGPPPAARNPQPRHEEGHLSAWHMKLRTKRGWTILVAEEANPRLPIQMFDPANDHMLSVDQRGKAAVHELATE